jgi:hypothetical protein
MQLPLYWLFLDLNNDQSDKINNIKMKKFIPFFFLISIAILFSCTSGKQKYLRISVDTYMDKVKAGWIGQMVGVGLGGPTEFKWEGRIIPEDSIPVWKPEMVNQFHQDDIYVEMTFLRTLEQYGFNVSIRQAGIDFANSRYALWHANRAGRDNLRSGIAPPASGHPAYNSHADDIDYQIEADYAGLISPGMPNLAIQLGEIFGRLMNYGDGLYGGQFVAGMYSEAFFENDMERIVRAGLKCIPEGSQYYECISDVLKWHKENPADWEKTWGLINEKYQLNPEYRKFSCSGPNDPFNIDAKINGAYIVMGLLYGDGDIKKTIVISTRCGQDSDCNPASSGGIICTTIGFKNLPDEYKSAMDYSTKFSYTDYNVSELIDVCAKLVRDAVIRSGGKIETGTGGKEYFLIPVEEPVRGVLEQCWDPASHPSDIRFTDEEMAQIRFRSIPPEAHINVWKVSKPYSKEGLNGLQLFDVVFPPEKDINQGGWKDMPFGNGYSTWVAELSKMPGGENVAAYLKTSIWSETARDAKIFLGSDDGIKVWLNGGLVHQNNVQRGFTPGEDSFPVKLKKGWNTCLLKVTQGTGGWEAAVAICDVDGKPLKGLRYKAE